MEHGLGAKLLSTLAIVAMAILGTGTVQRIMFLADREPAVAVAHRQEPVETAKDEVGQAQGQVDGRGSNEATLADTILGLLHVRGLTPSSHDVTGEGALPLGSSTDTGELLSSPGGESTQHVATDGPSLSGDIVDAVVSSTNGTSARRPLDLTSQASPSRWATEPEHPPADPETGSQGAALGDTLSMEPLSTEPVAQAWPGALPLDQWTPGGEPTGPRYLASGRDSDPTNGLAFMVLVLIWLKALTGRSPIDVQTGEANKIQANGRQPLLGLVSRLLHPLEEDIRKPEAHGEYGTSSERAYRLNAEEVYRPSLLLAQDVEESSEFAIQWLYFYNLVRPHLNSGMDVQLTLEELQSPRRIADETIPRLPPVLLDGIGAGALSAKDREDDQELSASDTPPIWVTDASALRENPFPREGTT